MSNVADFTPTRKPPVPRGTRVAGRRLWRSVVDVYELEEHELVLLREAVRLVDTLDSLQERADADGVVIEEDRRLKAHPAIVEARQHRIALARIMAALRLPAGDEEDTKRPQRRVGARGVYAMGGGS